MHLSIHMPIHVCAHMSTHMSIRSVAFTHRRPALLLANRTLVKTPVPSVVAADSALATAEGLVPGGAAGGQSSVATPSSEAGRGAEVVVKKKKMRRKRRDLKSGLPRHTLRMFEKHVSSTPEWKPYESIAEPLSDEAEEVRDACV